MAYKHFDANQPIDSSWGLIYRLNGLWQTLDIPAAAGDFEKWNNLLDRIFCNLLYKEDLEVIRDEETNEILDVRLSDKDQDVWDYLNRKYIEAKTEYKLARTRKEMITAKEKVYQALMMKDVGLRKFMFTLKLYLRQSDKNPSKAMWGG